MHQEGCRQGLNYQVGLAIFVCPASLVLLDYWTFMISKALFDISSLWAQLQCSNRLALPVRFSKQGDYCSLMRLQGAAVTRHLYKGTRRGPTSVFK